MKKVSFETLFEIPLRNGVTKPKKIRGKGYKMVNMGELFSYPIINNISMDRVPLTELEEKNSLLENYDLLFARQSLVRSGAGQCSIFISDDEKVCFESHIIRCRLDKNKANPLFYFYFFRSNIGRNIMDTIIEQGAGASGIRGSDLSKLMIPYIDIKIQNDIAEKLFSLDQKIALNTQTNQTLEQIAQGIFKHWFIDFAPVHAKANALARGETTEQAELAAMACLSGKTVEKITALKTQDLTAYHQLQQTAAAFPSEFVESGMGLVPKGWEVTTLNHICEMKNGYAFKSKEWTDEGIPVIKIGSVKPMLIELDNGSFVAPENETLRADFLASEGDILVGLTGYVGEVGRIPYQEKAMINQRVAKFIPKKITETMNYYCFIYCLARQKEFKAFTETNAKGSAQANISTREILSYPVIIATKEIHIAFENVVKNLLDKIIVNSGENSTLTKTRDGLLPRLLSGEIEL
ncbi:restriction endonuclease subunit S [Avibacterium gallinarum]|uniref:restriction endonuclease subunit S n=1 Tax=Avibacterium gallinarum TaxID=755 RepID=UPI003BF84AAC